MSEGPIKWQTGEGHAFNYECLVTVRDKKGETYVDIDFWDVHLNEWSFHNKHTGCEVIAWCKVEDVEPYRKKEE